MDSKLEDLERRLNILEQNSSESRSKLSNVTKKSKEPTEYNKYMSLRLKELKEEAEKNNINFDRRAAFSQVAKEWSQNKKK